MNLFRKLFYAFLYLRRPPWDTGVTPPELAAFITAHPLGKALDLGCGTGTNVVALARSGWQVAGVDFVVKAVKQARRKAESAGVRAEFFTADVTRLPEEIAASRYDLVLDIGCFHGLDAGGKQRYLDQLPGLLVSGGTYLLYGFMRQDEDGSPGGENKPRHDNRSGIGLTAADLRLLDTRLERLDRQDGFDHDRITSAWLTYTTCETL